MSNDLKRITEKIQALLRVKTGRGATEAEMQTAMAMAKKLADRYRIDMSLLREEEDRGNFTKAQFRTAPGECRRPPSDRHIRHILNRYFSVEIVLCYNMHDRIGSDLLFIGREADVQFAMFAYNFLKTTFNRLWTSYKKTSGAPQSERCEFFYGLEVGLSNKLWKAQEEVRTEARKAQKKLNAEAFAIVLVKEDEARKAWSLAEVEQEPYKSTKSKAVGFGDAFERGKEEGGKINVNHGLDDRG